MTTQEQFKASKDDFHRERSRFLDAYAELEAALQRDRRTPREKPLSDLLTTLSAIRNDLVHSNLRFAQVEGELHAIVVNTNAVCDAARPARLIRFADFKVLGSKVADATRRVAAP